MDTSKSTAISSSRVIKQREVDKHNAAYVPGSNPPKLPKIKLPKMPTLPNTFDMPMQDAVKDLSKKFKAGIHYVWVRYGGRKKDGHKTPAKFYRKSVYLAKAKKIWVPPSHEVIREIAMKANKYGHYVPT